jgi:hypothetical protein
MSMSDEPRAQGSERRPVGDPEPVEKHAEERAEQQNPAGDPEQTSEPSGELAEEQRTNPGPGTPGLHWGIRFAFLQYIARMPDGRCSVTGGAGVVADRIFHFEPEPETESGLGSGDGPGAGSGEVWRYRGDVRFSGHFGFLYVRIADPWLTLDGSSGTLSAETIGSDGPTRLDLVTFELRPLRDGEGRLRGHHGTDVRLTAAGSELFNTVYPAGDQFEDFGIVLPDLTPT